MDIELIYEMGWLDFAEDLRKINTHIMCWVCLVYCLLVVLKLEFSG